MKNITKFYNYKKLFKILTLITFYNLLPYITYAQWIKLEDSNTKTFNKINCIITDFKGNLYSAGNDNYVAKWDGSSWSKLGGSSASFNGNVKTIAADKYGNIYAAGKFKNSNGKFYIAKYDGNTWTEFGILDGLINNNLDSGIAEIVTDINGNLYATGNFFKGKINQRGCYVAKFVGSSRTILGDTNNILFDGLINSIALDVNGNVYTGGAFFKTVKGSNYLHYVNKWDGSSWNMVGNPDTLLMNIEINSVTTDLNLNVYATGGESFGGLKFVIKWNGNSWSKIGSDLYIPLAVLNKISSDESGNIYAAGNLVKLGVPYIAKWDGFSWSELGWDNTSILSGDNINTFTYDNKGTIYAVCNKMDKYYIAKYNISPTITSFTPTYVSTGGTVTIKGKNFNGTNSVTFGGVVAYSFTVINDTTINAIVGNGSTGSVSVTTLGGSSSLAGFIFNPYKLGILEIQNNQIQLYPNPAQETITIKSELNLNGKEYCIFDFVGKSVLKGKFSDDIKSLSVSELNNGVYILSIYDSNNKLISTNKVAIIK